MKSNLLALPEKKRVLSAKRLNRVIVIAGPTASGKTKLSLEIAQAIGGEIISADSCQVYRGMDIGTAKVSAQERLLITHHLIDICDLNEPFNVAEFYKASQEVMKEIIIRGNVPIVVGGSGFYMHALLYGPPLGPPSNPDLRKQLDQQMGELGPEVLYERLQMLDPEYAQTISDHDRHKIVRALEIIALSSRKVSDFAKESSSYPQEYNFRCWFIYYPRDQLYARIDLRCEEMIKNGLIDEVKALEQKGIRENLSASQAIGYRQALAYLKSPMSEDDWDRFVLQFKRASRQFAKRQFTWFRSEPLFRWVNIEEFDQEHLKELILQDFEQGKAPE